MSANIDKVVYFSTNENADVYVYSGAMNRSGSSAVVESYYRSNQQENGVLFLATYGGDAEAAYIIARFFQQMYKKFTIYIIGPCKSAGTLLALGAHEIIMDLQAELGPLDVQVLRDNDLWRRNSGLDIFQSLTTAGQHSYQIFETNFLRIKASSGGSINTETAADIASKIAIGLLAPITSQIDPLHLGEMQRAIGVANEYGRRLGASEEVVTKLITDYPSHGFVIDFEEAKELLKNVRRPSEFEQEVAQQVQELMRVTLGHECLKVPFQGTGAVAGFLPVPTLDAPDADAPDAQSADSPDAHVETQPDLPEEGLSPEGELGDAHEDSQNDAADAIGDLPAAAERINRATDGTDAPETDELSADSDKHGNKRAKTVRNKIQP